MPRHLRIFTVGLVLMGLWGCGGDDAKKDDKNAAANNAAGGAGAPAGGGGMPALAGPGMPGGGAPGGGMAGGMPGGMGGPGGAAAAPAEKAAADSAVSSMGLLQFIPEDIQVAAGASISAISDKSTPFSEQLMNQFQPVLAMLDGAGIKSNHIDQLWSGTNRDKGDMVICVRTKAEYNAPSVTKALGAAGAIEKVGKANLRRVSKNPDFPNAVAYVDTKTLLLGRYDTVVAALKNPKPGSIRFGLDALAQPNAMFWISGANDESVKKLNIRGFEGVNWFIAGAPKPRGMAVSITNENKAAQKSGGGQGGPPGGMPGGPPGGMRGGPPGGMPGMGMGMPGMGGGGDAGGATANRPIEIRVAWNFTSEAASELMNDIMQKMLDAINEANKPPSGAGGPGGMPPGGPGGMPPGGPGGMPPGGAGPGGMPPGGPGGRGGRGGRGRRGAEAANYIEPKTRGFFQGPPPGGMGMPGMPGMGGQVDDSKTTYYRIERTNENLKLIYHIPKDDKATITKLVGRVMTASGIPALDDGLFEGTLSALNKGIYGWEAAKPDPLVGLRRMGGPQRAIYTGYSWMTELLPYVGYEGVYGKFDFSQTWAAVYNAPYAQVVVPAFLNPADPRATWDGLGLPLAATHFAGMSGIEERRNEVAAELPRTDPRAGIFGYDKVARFNEISDGAAQTIMMVGTGEVVAPWVQGGGATIRGARQPYFDKFTGFGSRGLKSGAYVMFADGSARVVSANIEPEVFKAMCTIHGAEQIDMGKLVGQGGK